MNRIAPRILVAAVAATFALAGCGRDDNRATSANRPGSVTGATGGTASSPTTPGATPSPSGGGSAMSGGGAAPSGSSGASATTGTSSPTGTTGGTTASDTGAATPGTTPSAGTGTIGTTGPGSTGAATGSDTTGGTTGSGTSGSGSTTTTPGKSSSLDSTTVRAHVLPTADSTAADRQLSRSDKTFIEAAASGGLAEVEAGKLMSERATLPAVKQFAEQLVKDHTQANEELRRIAASYGVSLPATPEAKHRALVEKLASEKGSDLDREFIRTFGVKEHQKDIQDFRKQAQSGENAELKAFAARTLPKLQEHQAMAQRLEQELARK